MAGSTPPLPSGGVSPHHDDKSRHSNDNPHRMTYQRSRSDAQAIAPPLDSRTIFSHSPSRGARASGVYAPRRLGTRNENTYATMGKDAEKSPSPWSSSPTGGTSPCKATAAADAAERRPPWSPTIPLHEDARRVSGDDDDSGDDDGGDDDDGVALALRIASYLSLSDAESMASLYSLERHYHHPPRRRASGRDGVASGRGPASGGGGGGGSVDWYVGGRAMSSATSGSGAWPPTPETPGLIILSPPEESEWRDVSKEGHGELPSLGSWTGPEGGKGGSPSPPEAEPVSDEECSDCGVNIDESDDEEEEEVQRRLAQHQRQILQRKLTNAVFAHPESVRSYCLAAHQAAAQIQQERRAKERGPMLRRIRRWRAGAMDSLAEEEAEEDLREGTVLVSRQRQQSQGEEEPPETLREPVTPARSSSSDRLDICSYENATVGTSFGERYTCSTSSIQKPKRMRQRRRVQQRDRICRILVSKALKNVPLSVLLDLSESIFEVSLDTTVALGRLGVRSIRALISALCSIVHQIWETVAGFNPFVIVEIIVNAQRKAVGRTGEALVSGIQSVATGVGSAGNAALTRLSRSGIALSSRTGGSGSTASLNGGAMRSGGLGVRVGTKSCLEGENALSNKVFRRLNQMNSASKLISYTETNDEALTEHAKKRVQRMMHYHVSLRPFVATVAAPPAKVDRAETTEKPIKLNVSFENYDFPSHQDLNSAYMSLTGLPPEDDEEKDKASHASTPSATDSPFMCTPKSFPPTPGARALVLERGSRFAENVVFLARDQLRVEDSLGSTNAQTRAMATALREGNRLAVFNASDVGGGIVLSCGQHVATKVQTNVLYSSTRSMIPVLRNCYVYFEMSVSTPLIGNTINQHHHLNVATLSIGLSTLDMPLNTLVGAWKGSVGLCTTGQILQAGQWCSPLDPRLSSYGNNSTVGCLLCLDDGSAFDTWDGVMVTAVVTFNVNGTVVTPPVCSAPMDGDGGGFGFTPSSQSLRNTSVNNDSGTLHGVRDRGRRHHHHHHHHHHPVPASSTLPLFVPRNQELFPTLTLHSPGSQVTCRFCSDDILAKSRAEIGVPSGVTVFSVDGSVLFDEDVDEVCSVESEDDLEDGLDMSALDESEEEDEGVNSL